jgi:hypothetical protein
MRTSDGETRRLVQAILASQEISADRLAGMSVTRSGDVGAIPVAGLSATRFGDSGTIPPPSSLDARIERVLDRIAGRRRADRRKTTEQSQIDPIRPADGLAAPPPVRRDPASGADLPDTSPWAGYSSGLARLAARFAGTVPNSVPGQAADTGGPAPAPWPPMRADRGSADDDQLAERLAEILRREARRQGIDLSGSGT